MSMKNQKRVCAIAFSVLYILILLGEIAIIILKQYTASLYLLFPALLLVPIYLTFTRVPKETNYHVFHLILLILLRYLLIAIALLLPVLFTKYVPLFQKTSYLYLFASAGEVLSVYIIIYVQYLISLLQDNKSSAEKKK